MEGLEELTEKVAVESEVKEETCEKTQTRQTGEIPEQPI